MKDETIQDIGYVILLITFPIASIIQLYKYDLLLNNSFEIVFTPLIEAIIFALMLLGFYVLFNERRNRNNAPTIVETAVEMPLDTSEVI